MSKAYKVDQKEAQDAEEKFLNNPYEPGTRRHRLFDKAQKRRLYWDDIFDEMEAVYGTIGERRPDRRVNNPPWSPEESHGSLHNLEVRKFP